MPVNHWRMEGNTPRCACQPWENGGKTRLVMPVNHGREGIRRASLCLSTMGERGLDAPRCVCQPWERGLDAPRYVCHTGGREA